MCRNQLGRRNLTEAQRDCIIAEQYEAQRLTQGTNNQYVQAKSEKHQNDDFQKFRNTAAKVAHDIGSNEIAVTRAVQFSRGLDAAEKVSPGIKEAVLSGSIKAPKSVISEIRNLSDEEKEKAVNAIKEGKKPTIQKPKQPRLSSSDIDLIEKSGGDIKGFSIAKTQNVVAWKIYLHKRLTRDRSCGNIAV